MTHDTSSGTDENTRLDGLGSTENIIAAAWLDGELPARVEFDPAGYVADDALRRAVNAALALGMPLLLTGEPGVGKTQLAYRLAWELDRERSRKSGRKNDRPLRFDTKSTSVAADLFYQFDSVRYFGDSQLAAAKEDDSPPAAKEYITYRALGQAVLDSRPWSEVAHLQPAPRQQASTTSDASPDAEPHVDRPPLRRVVLIDEIDKAPRDFPNDLLSQLEGIYRFDVPELKAWGIEIDPKLRPVVVITSNSERQLPEAFLRRCVFHHIALPVEEAAREDWIHRVLTEHFGDADARQLTESATTRDAVQAFWRLREHPNLAKKPSTPELLDWLRVLRGSSLDLAQRLHQQPVRVLQGTLGVLLKTGDDLALGTSLIVGAMAGR